MSIPPVTMDGRGAEPRPPEKLFYRDERAPDGWRRTQGRRTQRSSLIRR